ncbi:MAG: hypothetical protein JWN04_3480 [Myxococcaceae bacterium]|nr:hypothetical protein [Myxococcaceae bacterium]
MTKTLGAALCVVLGALLPGCSEQPVVQQRPQGLLPGEDVSRPSAAPRVVRTPPTPPPAPPPRSSLPSPFATAADPGALAKSAQAQLASLAAPDAGDRAPDLSAGPAAAAPVTAPRDLPTELISMLGQPADCLDLAAVASGGGRTTISLTVSVMPSGRVIRASADAPNQPASGLRCLEQKASAAKFRSPVPGAPLDVTATIPIEVVAQPDRR